MLVAGASARVRAGAGARVEQAWRWKLCGLHRVKGARQRVAYSRERERRQELGVSARRHVVLRGELLQRRAAAVRLRCAAADVDVVGEGDVHELPHGREGALVAGAAAACEEAVSRRRLRQQRGQRVLPLQ